MSLTKTSLLAAIVIAIVFLHISGTADLFTGDGVRSLSARLQHCPPPVYIALFSVAPMLLLPATPFVIVAGLLYGPFWGFIHAMTGATIGATLAFLASRHLLSVPTSFNPSSFSLPVEGTARVRADRLFPAAACVLRKLTGPRWSRLQARVETDGWKVVAATRLIPVFPFNLVNYAFGMTRVKLTHYILATAAGMSPACLGLVLFSSSITDIMESRISWRLGVGAGFIAVVIALPIAYIHFTKGEKQ